MDYQINDDYILKAIFFSFLPIRTRSGDYFLLEIFYCKILVILSARLVHSFMISRTRATKATEMDLERLN